MWVLNKVVMYYVCMIKGVDMFFEKYGGMKMMFLIGEVCMR